MIRRALLPLAAGLVLALAACESGPSGPGTLSGTVTAPQGTTLGAVVLEITGPGIQGFEGQAGSEAYGALVSAENDQYRLVVAGTGDLGFGVKVDDVKGPTPTVQVVAAVNDANAGISITGIQAKVGR